MEDSPAEAFAKTVLMALATLSSEQYKTNQMLAEIRSGKPIKSWKAALENWEDEAGRMQDLMYKTFLKQAKLPPDDPSGGATVVDAGGPN